MASGRTSPPGGPMGAGAGTLVVAGMHRSGTSVTAQWLERCGLHAGEGIATAVESNPRGQFEDHDFVRFHEQILRRHGFKSSLVGGAVPLHPDEEERRAALQLIESRTHRGLWGWKDPRTTLFLPFWKQLLPDLRVLGVYRPPAAVVDSLIRRRRSRQRRKRPATLLGKTGAVWLLRRSRSLARRSWLNLTLVREYADVWRRYNAELLAFARRYPDDLLLFRVDRLLERSEELVTALNGRWKLDLNPVPMRAVFDGGLMRPAARTLRRTALLRRLAPAVAAAERELAQLERSSFERLGVADVELD